MDNFIKKIIEETFASKKQQRYFYAKANDETLSKKERNKWKRMAKEFSDKTNFKKLPEKVKEEEVDEVVDEDGNFIKSDIPLSSKTSGITSKSTTDDVVKTGTGQMGTFGIAGGGNTHRTLRYWAEADLTKQLGYDDTAKKDVSYNDAEEHFKDDLGLSPEETKEKLNNIGYDENLPDGKIRLIENPKKYIEDYLENILPKKNKSEDVIDKDNKILPIVKKQVEALKNTLKNNDLTLKDVIKYIEDNESTIEGKGI